MSTVCTASPAVCLRMITLISVYSAFSERNTLLHTPSRHSTQEPAWDWLPDLGNHVGMCIASTCTFATLHLALVCFARDSGAVNPHNTLSTSSTSLDMSQNVHSSCLSLWLQKPMLSRTASLRNYPHGAVFKAVMGPCLCMVPRHEIWTDFQSASRAHDFQSSAESQSAPVHLVSQPQYFRLQCCITANEFCICS